jgi:hypothetical protein
MESDKDREQPKKPDGNGREIKEPPKENEGGLKIDIEMPPGKPSDKG